MGPVRGRVRRLFRLGGVRRDVDDELRFHFENAVDELVSAGQTREEAEREARRRFGDVGRYRAELEGIDRSAAVWRRRRERLDATVHTLKYAVRSLRRSPGLSAGIVLAFALGIGANATMFGIIDRLLLKPPSHFDDPGSVRRVVVEREVLGRTVRAVTLSIGDIEDLDSVPQFGQVAAYSSTYDWILGRGESARPVNGVFATGSFWDLVGVEPVIGRFFGPNEDRAGAERVVVIGHALWRSRFGGDRSAVGTTIDFGWGPYTVIGVTPAGFTGPYLAAVDLWLPVRSAGQVIRGERWLTDGRRYNWLRGLARLAPVATIELAEEVATALHRRGRSELIANGDYDANARIRATPLIAARGPDGSREARVSLWLAGVSAIVLLIACVNVANLLLARSLLRRRETAIRLAIGVPRGRLVADTMTEGLLLSLAGGAAALVVARWGGGLIRGTLLPNVEWTASGVDGMTLAFVLALALLGGLLATLIPAIESQRRDVADVLRATAGNISRSSQRTRMALTVAQAALSVILLVGAGLFVRSLDRVRSLDLGFELDNLYIAQPIEVADARSDTANTGIVVTASRARYATAAEQLARVPGVASAAYSIGVPFYTSWSVDLAVPGRDSIPVHPTGGPYITIVSRDYLPTMDVRVLRGRGFEAGDFTGAGLVAVVNNTMAGFVWPGQDPLGQCLRVELLEGPCTTVVGIVEDARRASIVEQPTPQFYVPLPHPVAASLDPEMMLVRTTASDGSLIRRIRDAMMAADPALRFVTVRPLESMAAVELRPWQLGATLFGIFGLVALAVAALGLYSVLSFDVAQRTREIGLRSALGATVGRLLVGLVGRGVRMTAIGLLIGLAVASLLAPFARDLLYDVSPRDPVTIAVVSAVLLFVAVIAGLLPAWRAASVDPRIALLEE